MRVAQTNFNTARLACGGNRVPAAVRIMTSPFGCAEPHAHLTGAIWRRSEVATELGRRLACAILAAGHPTTHDLTNLGHVPQCRNCFPQKIRIIESGDDDGKSLGQGAMGGLPTLLAPQEDSPQRGPKQPGDQGK